MVKQLNGYTSPDGLNDPFRGTVGYSNVKRQLQSVVDFVLTGGMGGPAHSIPRRILLHGPPGTGKTHLAYQLMDASRMENWYDPGSALVSRGLKGIQKLFERRDAIIIIDDIDYIVRRRDGLEQQSSERLRQEVFDRLLLELETVRDRNMVFVALANRVSLIDDKFLHLMDLQIEVPLPNQSMRQDILQAFGARVGADWTAAEVEGFARRTVGSSGRKLNRLVEAAAQQAAGDHLDALRACCTGTRTSLAFLPDAAPDVIYEPAFVAGSAAPGSVTTVYWQASAPENPDSSAVPSVESLAVISDSAGIWVTPLPVKPGAQVEVWTGEGDQRQSVCFTVAAGKRRTSAAHLMRAIAQVRLTLPDTHDLPSIVEKLSERVIGQDTAKNKLGFAAAMHFTQARENLENPAGMTFDSNVLLIGPEGGGKGELSQALASALDVPWVRCSAAALYQRDAQGVIVGLLRDLYEASAGDIIKAEHGIVYLSDIDALAQMMRGEYARAVGLLQDRIASVIEGEVVEFSPSTASGSAAPIQFYTGNLFFICAGSFSGLEERVRSRLSNPDALSYSQLMSNLQLQDLINYGLSARLIELLSITIPMDDLSLDEITTIIQSQWAGGTAGAYQQIMARQGVEIELTDDGLRQLAEEAKARKMGSKSIAGVIRDLYSYLWSHRNPSVSYILVDKPFVKQALSGREVTRERSSVDDAITLSEIPDVTYDQIGGLEREIGKIKREIEYPYRYAHLYRRYGLQRPKGILLYGPPGTGKTMVAKAVANSLQSEIRRSLETLVQAHVLLDSLRAADPAAPVSEGQAAQLAEWVRLAAPPNPITFTNVGELTTALLAHLDGVMGIPADQVEREAARAAQNLQRGTRAHFFSIKGAQLTNKYVGETERSIRELFAEAQARASATTPVVIFFDEMEALFSQRGMRDNPLAQTVVPQILAEIDGLDAMNDVIIIGATNHPEMLDPALTRPGRLDIKVEVPRPHRAAARSILNKYLTPDTPFDTADVGGDITGEALARAMSERLLNLIYADHSTIRVVGHNAIRTDRADHFPWRGFISGALIANIIQTAKRLAVNRQIQTGTVGLRWSDLRSATIDEFEQNKKIFGFEAIQSMLLMGGLVESIRFESLPASDDSLASLDVWSQATEKPWERLIYKHMDVEGGH